MTENTKKILITTTKVVAWVVIPGSIVWIGWELYKKYGKRPAQTGPKASEPDDKFKNVKPGNDLLNGNNVTLTNTISR